MTNRAAIHRRAAPPSARLLLLADSCDAHGQPRPALWLPAGSGTASRPRLVLFHSIDAALAAKRAAEGTRYG
jgi:hypothetical protein